MSSVKPEVIRFSREQAAEARGDLNRFLAAYEAWVAAPEGAPDERALRTALSRSIPGAERALVYGGEGQPTWGYIGGPQWVGLPNIVFQADPDSILDVVHRADAELERQDKLFEQQQRRESPAAPSGSAPHAEVAVRGMKSPSARRMSATLDDMTAVLAAVDQLVKDPRDDAGSNNAVRAVTLMTAGLARWTSSESPYREQARQLLSQQPSADPAVVPLVKSIVLALGDDLRAGRAHPPAYAPGIEHAANRLGGFLAALIIPVLLAILCVAVLATLTVSPVFGLPALVVWGAVVFLLALTLSGLVSQLAGPRRWLARRIAGRLIGPLSR